jgi:mono/diheme cytochrome c family protein
MVQFRWMADEDIAAVIGYMRSGSPDFEPWPEKAPPTKLTFLGNAIGVFVLGINPDPRTPVKAPPRGPTAEYGKYLAQGVYDCLYCHTAGFANNDVKEKHPEAFAGGFEYIVPEADGIIYSANITPHETQGIGKWTLEQFKLALREGVTPDRHVLRKPMPRYRYVDDVEIEAIYAFLKTVPVAETPKLAKTPVPRPKAEGLDGNPEKLFTSLGCTYCHGPKGQFRDRLKNALGKQPEEVAKWIRNPESFKPGTQMPTFASLIDERQAVELAKWVQAKNGTP